MIQKGVELALEKMWIEWQDDTQCDLLSPMALRASGEKILSHKLHDNDYLECNFDILNNNRKYDYIVDNNFD